MAKDKKDVQVIVKPRDNRYLTMTQKTDILHEYYRCGKVKTVCEMYDISTPTFYKVKKENWSDFLNNMEDESRLTGVEMILKNSNPALNKTSEIANSVLLKCLSIMDRKMDMEIAAMNGEEVKQTDRLSFGAMISFFNIAAPYLLKMRDKDNEMGVANLALNHTYITNILTEQSLRLYGNGNNKSTDQRN